MDVPANKFLAEAIAKLISTIMMPATGVPSVHLAVAPFAPGAALDPTTLTEASWTGYSSFAVTSWGVGHLLSNGTYVASAEQVAYYAPTAVLTESQTVYGWWMMDGAGNLVASGLFATPIVVSGPSTPVAFVPTFGVGPWQYTTINIP